MGKKHRFLPHHSPEDIARIQLEGLKMDRGPRGRQGSPFYRRRLKEAGVNKAEDIRSLDDLTRLPFTTAQTSRRAIPSRSCP